MTDYKAMEKARYKWLRELGAASDGFPGTKGLAAYARGYLDAIKDVADAALAVRAPEGERAVPMSYRAFSSPVVFRDYCMNKCNGNDLEAWGYAYGLWLKEVGRSLPPELHGDQQ